MGVSKLAPTDAGFACPFVHQCDKPATICSLIIVCVVCLYTHCDYYRRRLGNRAGIIPSDVLLKLPVRFASFRGIGPTLLCWLTLMLASCPCTRRNDKAITLVLRS